MASLDATTVVLEASWGQVRLPRASVLSIALAAERPGFLGVHGATADRAAPAPDAPASGVRIGGVVPSSPADKAGLRAGDVIVRIGAPGALARVATWDDLASPLARRRPGERIALDVRRANASGSAEPTLELSFEVELAPPPRE